MNQNARCTEHKYVIVRKKLAKGAEKDSIWILCEEKFGLVWAGCLVEEVLGRVLTTGRDCFMFFASEAKAKAKICTLKSDASECKVGVLKLEIQCGPPVFTDVKYEGE